MKLAVVALVACVLVVGAAAENHFTYHVQDGDFTVNSVDLTTQNDIPYQAGAKATVQLSGTVKDASKILAGTIQYKIYENYVQHFTDSGNEEYFECNNKGCNRYHGVGLDLADPDATTSSAFTASLTFAMPTPEKTGQFRMVMWGSNQNHFPYDFSVTIGFNYTSSAGAVAAVAEPTPVLTPAPSSSSSASSDEPGKITWAASNGNISISTFEILVPSGKFAASDSAHVKATGTLDKALTAGAVQWQIYEQGVRSFIESGNSNYFKCTNKGCNILEPIALKLDSSSVPTDCTLSFAFNVPTPEATGQFTLVAWGTDQDHFPYDFSVSVHFSVPMEE